MMSDPNALKVEVLSALTVEVLSALMVEALPALSVEALSVLSLEAPSVLSTEVLSVLILPVCSSWETLSLPPSAILGNVPESRPSLHLVDGVVLGHKLLLVREDVQLGGNVCNEHVSFNKIINIYKNNRNHTKYSKSSLKRTSFWLKHV
jgi:hypothetical protein